MLREACIVLALFGVSSNAVFVGVGVRPVGSPPKFVLDENIDGDAIERRDLPRVRSFSLFGTLIDVAPARVIFEEVAALSGTQSFPALRVRSQTMSDGSWAGIFDVYQSLSGCTAEERTALQEYELAVTARSVSLISVTAAFMRDGDVVVGDSHLPTESLQQMLRIAGLSARVSLFVSPSGMHNGTIWPAIKERFMLERHVGTDDFADVLSPSSFGIPVTLPSTNRRADASGSGVDRIDAWLYINLRHRTDRRAHIEQQLRSINVSTDRVYRIEAVYDAVGLVGCATSHIAALRFAAAHLEWHRVAILEDDFTWDDPSRVGDALTSLFAECPDVHVFMCAMGREVRRLQPAEGGLHKVFQGVTASGYIVVSHYIPVLLRNLEEGLELLRATGQHELYALDRYFHKLQRAHRWRTTLPLLGFQMSGYSDIEGGAFDYDLRLTNPGWASYLHGRGASDGMT